MVSRSTARPVLPGAVQALGAACAAIALLTVAGCGQVPSAPAAAAPEQVSTSQPSGQPTNVDSPETRSTGNSTAPATVPAPSATTAPAGPTPTTTPIAPKPKPTPAPPKPILAKGDKGEKVRELQHRLRQVGWYSGKITGTYGSGTVKGVKGFQDKRGYPETGHVDAKTWKKLVAMTRKPSKAEMHNKLVPGPAIMKSGSSGDRVRGLQARLKQIGWFSGKVTGQYGAVTVAAVKGFQGRRAIPVTGEVDQRTWDRLVTMTRTPTNDQLHNRIPKPSAAGLDPRCMTGRALCISKRTNTLVWVVDGKPKLRMDVRFGSAELPTREGSFAVGWKSRNHVSTIYHTKMPYAMFFSGGQAVHYSPDFAYRGYNGASHGCVNVRNLSGIQWLFGQVRVGDKVIVYR